MKIGQLCLWSAIYCLLASISVLCKDYYEILGVKKTATNRDIKKAFPYEVLSDEEKRKQYDQFGDSAFNGGGNGDSESSNFNFNFDEFFKGFDSMFKNHNHAHQRAHFSAHQRAHSFRFGSNSFFEDLFDDFGDGLDMDSDPFGDDLFGGAFHFNNFGNMHQQHMRSHFDMHNNMHNGHMHQTQHSFRSQTNGQRCQQVTKRMGNMVQTYTICS
ncbi:hypothetical protein LSH36_30g03068 [Paralvinella palmiformis]|uniref:DnaJ homolog subfamily B member 9 n=1 Tax=Paralvinella palmiformis TaxID=53620 RepID=A0AAD9NHE9_9ANNE|nr:hypothetical protein LSH36_30g03068 [Paralvinella palmiformis]